MRVGIDPLVEKFKSSYPSDMLTRASYFTESAFRELTPNGKAKAVTSIAMFYDLEDPGRFVADIAAVLHDDGIWVFEQSYMPRMLELISYDTICHEHLEYYALAQIEHLLKRHGLRVFDVELNNINGGSFRVFVCHRESARADYAPRLSHLRDYEARGRFQTQGPFDVFRGHCERLRHDLRALINTEVAKGRRVHLYGASTKGNTILQYCGLDHTLIEAAADRNPEKWGARTPATSIPIISEQDSRARRPDYFLVLPWHFRKEFIEREAEFLAMGGKFIFPLPRVEVI